MMSRRSLLAAPALILVRKADAAYISYGVSNNAFPGQIGNPVGFAAAPGYSGNATGSGLTPITNTTQLPGGAFLNNRTLSFFDIDLGFDPTLDNTHSNLTFIGCRWQRSGAGATNTGTVGGGTGATGLTYSYCSMVPKVSVAGFAPPVANVVPVLRYGQLVYWNRDE